MKALKNGAYRIYTLGEFEVIKDEDSLTGTAASSKKIWELYKFMLTNRTRKFTPETLNDQVWISESYSDPRVTLRRQMHRMRQLLKEDHLPETEWTIRFENGYYFWNPNLKVQIDSADFESFLTAENCNDPDVLSNCLKAISIYKGDYLPDLYEQHWVFSVRNYYRRLFLNALNDAVDTLYGLGDYSRILDLCQQAIQIDTYEERFHIEYMKALTAINRKKDALAHYDEITSFYYREMGLKPSEDFKNLYKLLVSTVPQRDTEDFIASLTAPETFENAFYVEPDIFKSICELEKRRNERDGKTFIVAVLRLTPLAKQHSLAREQYRIKHFTSHLMTHLRKGDSFTLWNQYQFLILIHGASESGLHAMMDRVIQNYEQPEYLSVDYVEAMPQTYR
ncbi:AfsR/SARP family transcriptional regulator [Fusibacter tunisiensis]|uniref:DNA-binding SARP family transcriptional activator n=1 Tax=Fusibacter tunisiensis TaxID=1008308 RepID=A0ABS2MNP5_9FIRM|nr:bacterial transcriptional activator domain-containing protein [Fusibacter tunisiensis]MBM7560942.1 DNA-binding SARP family transcriptional activator [Fusibacter tunisiensis]